MQNANRKLTKLGGQMQKIGAGLSVGVTLPLLGLGATAIKAAADMETLKTSLDTVFQGDKAASNSAFEQIKEFAATTPFQLDEVATAFIKLKNLGLDPSIASLTSYGNTASALGKSLDQMIEAVADASVGEFERLKEFGIKAKSQGDNVAFTFQGVTTTVGKNSAEISKYLQDIGNTNFAGSIERQSQTFSGKMSTLRDNMQQAFAGIGEIIIEYVSPLFNKLNSILQKFQELSPETKKWIVILGGVVAAVGPLLALAGTILPAIITGFTLLTGPIGLIIAALTAVGVIIYKNWAPIKKTLIDIANYFIDLYNESTVFRIAVEAVVATFKTFFEIGKFAFEALKSLLSGFVNQFVTGFKSIGEIIKAVLTGNISALPGIVKKAVSETKTNFSGLTDDLGNDWKNLLSGITKVTNDGLANITSRKKLAYIKENVDATAITDAVSDATRLGLKKGAEGGSGNSTTVDTSTPEIYDTAALDKFLTEQGVKIDEAKSQVSGESFISSMAIAMDEDLTSMTEGMNAFVEDFNAKAERLAEIGVLVGESVGGAFESLSGRLIESLGLASTGFQGFIGGLVKTVTKLIAMMLSASISQSIAGATASGTATGPAAIFTTPAFIATAVSGVLAAFAAIPKFETGGVVGGSSFYGDKLLARVNSGELILNKDQQKTLYGLVNQSDAQQIFIPNAIIKGEDIVLSYERANIRKDRRS